MTSEYVYNLYLIIPIGGRNRASRVVQDILGDRADVGDDLNFDSIRLSTTGQEPATHLATSLPLTRRMAKLWANLLFIGETLPDGLPDVSFNHDPLDLLAITNVIANARFSAVITSRLGEDDRTLVRANQVVRVINSVKFPNVRTVPSIKAIRERVGLVRIVPDLDGE